MKIALVHDYLNEFGGGERVLRVLADMYPDAPIYTAFVVDGGSAARAFADRRIVESSWAWILKVWRLYSPLRFLLPMVWGRMDLTDYDVVITSCSGYIARGFRVGKRTKVIAYCHTPPRNLYGLQAAINWMGKDWAKFWPAKLYALVVNHFVRLFDFESAQRVDIWLCNSYNVKLRVAKFYRKEAKVVYPPVEVEKISVVDSGGKEDYWLVVSRVVADKGLEAAAKMAGDCKVKLKIAGEAAGGADLVKKLENWGGGYVEMLGRVDDGELPELLARAKGFLALAKNEDFGMTVVEAMAAGTPVIAYRGGGFLESIIENKTGIFVDDVDTESLKKGMAKFNKIKWRKSDLVNQAMKFSRAKFEQEIAKIVAKYA